MLVVATYIGIENYGVCGASIVLSLMTLVLSLRDGLVLRLSILCVIMCFLFFSGSLFRMTFDDPAMHKSSSLTFMFIWYSLGSFMYVCCGSCTVTFRYVLVVCSHHISISTSMLCCVLFKIRLLSLFLKGKLVHRFV